MKKIIFVLTFILIANLIFSNPVDIAKATLVAQNFCKSKSAFNGKSSVELLYSQLDENNVTAYYVFKVVPNGFVIVSANDAAVPILGYSAENEFQYPVEFPAIVEFFQNYETQIKYASEKNLTATQEVIDKWDRIINLQDINNNGTKAVAELLTTTWNQQPYYNEKCPADAASQAGNGHTFTGCVATAMAQIMKFWGYPVQGAGQKSYNHKDYGTLSADFGNTIYNWTLMPNALNKNSSQAEIDEVAQLMFHCGVSVNMNYGISGSGGSLSTSPFINYFDYSGYSCSRNSDPVWIDTLKSALNKGRPIIYRGDNGGGGGHAWVCDGYDNDNSFHMNWGWGGMYNGYFFITNLTPGQGGAGAGDGKYNLSNALVVVYPNGTNPNLPVIADFSFDPSMMPITEGTCLNFYDMSKGYPNSYSWSFPGSTQLVTQQQNPKNICYMNKGTYDVTLVVCNAKNECHTNICIGCIVVDPDPFPPIIDFEGTPLVIEKNKTVSFKNLSKNGPYTSWLWQFPGGSPDEVTDSTPQSIYYDAVGEFDVTLRAWKQNYPAPTLTTKNKYIRVVEPPTTPPTANFVANYTFIAPGDSINFIDLSTGTPFTWTWEFEGVSAQQAKNYSQHPKNIKYPNAGKFKVRLIVSNSLGKDTLVRTQYIVVSNTDNCTEKPIASFTTNNGRLLAVNDCIYFENTSTGGNPTYSRWVFTSTTSTVVLEETNPTNPICFPKTGWYDVKLTVSNKCGSSPHEKLNYIYVFTNHIASFCDTISSLGKGESYTANEYPKATGYMVGHNSKKYKYFANYFDTWSFNQIKGIIIPLKEVVSGADKNYVNFCIWEPNGDKPADAALYTQKVLLKNLVANQNNYIAFNTPVEINGPFYVGFEVNYTDADKDGNYDDIMGAYVINKANVDKNCLFLKKNKDSEWQSSVELFSSSNAIMIKPVACVLETEDIKVDDNILIYPNPTNGSFTIHGIQSADIQVFNITGQMVYSKENLNDNAEITIKNINTGIYFVKIISKNNSFVKKIIIEK